MSLSDKERVEYIYDSIKNIMEKRKYLEKHQRLVELVDQLWPSALGQDGNSMHWIIGSSATNNVCCNQNLKSPWSLAIGGELENCVEPENQENVKFDAFDHSLGISNLLGLYDKNVAAVYDVFAWTEQLVYGLRRYKDDFLAKMKRLSDVVASIQGECYAIFCGQKAYARAYTIHNICRIMYGNQYPYHDVGDDWVLDWLDSSSAHHNLTAQTDPYRKGNISLGELIKIHRNLVVAKYCADNAHRNSGARRDFNFERLRAYFKLSGRRCHYQHIYDGLRQTVVKKLKPSQVEELDNLFAQCQKLHNEDNIKNCSIDSCIEKEMAYVDYNDLTNIKKKYKVK